MSHLNKNQLLQLIDGTLSEPKKQEYLGHIRECKLCSDSLASIINFERRIRSFLKSEGERCPNPLDIWSYEQGLLDVEKAEKIRQHLSYCSICAQELKSASEIADLLDKLDEEETEKRRMKSLVGAYVILVATRILSRPYVRLGIGAAPSKSRLEHEDETFRWGIYQEENNLIFSLVTKSKEYVGKYITISVRSANEVDYRPGIIQWEQEVQRIGSDKPINPRGWIEFVIAKTRLDMDIEEDFNLLQQIFQEIELRIFAEKSEDNNL